MSVFLTSMIRRADKMLHCLQPVQVREIRARVCGSQTAFAARFGLSARTLAQWESGRRSPDRAASALLKVIAHAPETVEAALDAYPTAIQAFARGAETERDERAARLSSKRASGWDTDMSSGSD
jgi:DNA-binding transcriptional regulator YiaG